MLQEALRAPALVPRTHTFKPSPLSQVSGVHFNSISPGFNWLPHRCTGPGPGSGLGQDETQHVPGTCDRPGPVQISSPGSTQDCPVMHTIPPPRFYPHVHKHIQMETETRREGGELLHLQCLGSDTIEIQTM